VNALVKADRIWREKLLIRRVALESWPGALDCQRDDVKVVIEVNSP